MRAGGGAAAAVAFFCVSCLPDLAVDPSAQLQCASGGECPAGFVCAASLGACIDENSPCIADGDAVQNGAPCEEEGVCFSGSCVDRFCGDAFVDVAAGEQCDPAVGGAGCRADCSLAFCGDGIVDDDELCDDGGASCRSCINTCGDLDNDVFRAECDGDPATPCECFGASIGTMGETEIDSGARFTFHGRLYVSANIVEDDLNHVLAVDPALGVVGRSDDGVLNVARDGDLLYVSIAESDTVSAVIELDADTLDFGPPLITDLPIIYGFVIGGDRLYGAAEEGVVIGDLIDNSHRVVAQPLDFFTNVIQCGDRLYLDGAESGGLLRFDPADESFVELHPRRGRDPGVAVACVDDAAVWFDDSALFTDRGGDAIALGRLLPGRTHVAEAVVVGDQLVLTQSPDLLGMVYVLDLGLDGDGDRLPRPVLQGSLLGVVDGVVVTFQPNGTLTAQPL